MCATAATDDLNEISRKFSVPILTLASFDAGFSAKLSVGLINSYVNSSLASSSKLVSVARNSARRKSFKHKRRSIGSQALLARANFPFVVINKGQSRGRVPVSSRPPKR